MSLKAWRQARPLRLRFVGGDHKGAAESLAPGLWSLGGGADCQIRLGDPALAGARLTLDARWPFAPFGPRLRLESGEAKLDGAPLTPGRWRRARDGSRVDMGAQSFALGVPSPSSSGVPLAPLAALGLGLAALATGFDRPAPSSQPSALLAVATPETPGEAAEEAARALSERLTAAGAGLHAEADRAAGLVRVTGAPNARDKEIWARERVWFDEAYGARVALEARLSAVKSSAVDLPFALRSIWSAPEPMIVLHDGARRHPGDMLPGGWRLVSVEEGAAVIELSGRRLTLAP